jgi:hypothetical protein
MNFNTAADSWPLYTEPAPVAPYSGPPTSIHVPTLFNETAQTYRPRAPISSPENLVRIVAKGACLEPVHSAHTSIVSIDPALRATDGDVVLVEFDEPTRALIADDWQRHPGNRIGDEPPRRALKLLRHVFGQRVLLCRTGAFLLGGSKILGVAVREQPLVAWS